MAKKYTRTTNKEQLILRINENIDHYWNKERKEMEKRPFKIPFWIAAFLLFASNFLWIVL